MVEEDLEEPIDNIRALNNTGQASSHKPYMVTVHIEGKPMQMEIDTGACVSIVNHKVYKKLCTKKLKPSQAKLKGYAGHSIKVIGEAEVNVCHNGQQATLPLVVVKGAGPSLLGRNWLNDWTGKRST